ncbi:uncharacterized protein BDZ83DRAFT_731042 [Colletotrichum acutatum]|uniref:Uncharacterized protein n=1 Tax=Glomerella acutata TaxID=27357 RepID=A0AAD8UQH1_GLOAC|nr:uncharacterized protein BDZ83DRAFT_731042 [Colletotrichum acutatum]KAK1724600.1 hypothetical protein BDZ83DRAFT_731042 [Colletotrichum acutatum]
MYALSSFTRGTGRSPSLKDPNRMAIYEEIHITSPAGCCTKDPPPHRLESAVGYPYLGLATINSSESHSIGARTRVSGKLPTKPRTLEFVILNVSEVLIRNIKEICHGASFQDERFLAGVRSIPAERRDSDQNNSNSPTRLIRLLCTCITKTRYLTMHSRLDVGLVIHPMVKCCSSL